MFGVFVDAENVSRRRYQYLFAMRIIGTVFFLIGTFLFLREFVPLAAFLGTIPAEYKAFLGTGEGNLVYELFLRYYVGRALQGAVLMAMGLYLMKSRCRFLLNHCGLDSASETAATSVERVPTMSQTNHQNDEPDAEDHSRFMPRSR